MRKRLKTIGMESKKERYLKAKAHLRSLEINKISEETIEKMKTLNKVNWEVYKELIKNKQIVAVYKFKTPKSIFFDEAEDKFLFFNPVYRKLFFCAKFVE